MYRIIWKSYQIRLKNNVKPYAFFIFPSWGDDSRKDHSRLAMLCATFPSVTLVLLTATASKKDVSEIKESSNLKSPLEVTVNPNKSNIFYQKSLRPRRRCRFHGRNSQAQCNTRENSDISTNFVISVFGMVWFCTQVFREEFGH